MAVHADIFLFIVGYCVMDKTQENKIITEAIEKSGIKIIVIQIAKC